MEGAPWADFLFNLLITREIFSAKQRERVKKEYTEYMLDLVSEYRLGDDAAFLSMQKAHDFGK